MININMDKAREIHKQNIREMRQPLFQKADVEYIIALEKGDEIKVNEIKEIKQALRDATSYEGIYTAQTPEELKEAIPPILK